MKMPEKLSPKMVADRMNGREYGNEVTEEEANELDFHGLTVVYGYSDDNVELEGSISDEIGCYDTITIPILDGDILKKCSDDCDDYDCPFWRDALARAKNIRATFTSDGWKFETDFPCEKFTIMEDGEVYGEGIVFAMEDLHYGENA